MYNVIIIGGMAAGCKAAARLNRLCPNYQITIIEKSSFVSFSSCGLPLYVSGEINDLSDLNKTSYGILRDKKYFREVKGVRVLIKTEAEEIDIENKAKKLGYNTGSVIGCWYDRPDYLPESKNLLGKLVYEKPGLKLLGLQLVGEGEVTRYIDVFSELLSHNGKIEDLLNVEHSYTPAHSSPISPLNYLGYMAINQEKDGVKNYNPFLLSSFNGIFIDVREPSEIESTKFSFHADRFPGKSIQIPLSELRLKLNDFDLDEPIMCVCEKGTRAYEAARIFINYGYKNISYLGGGYLLCNKIYKFSNYLETSYEQ